MEIEESCAGFLVLLYPVRNLKERLQVGANMFSLFHPVFQMIRKVGICLAKQSGHSEHIPFYLGFNVQR